MRFVVYGSLRYNGCPVDKVREAAKAIGAAIANHGHSVIVCSDNETTVDLYIVQGVDSVTGRHEVIVDRPEVLPSKDPERSLMSYPFSNASEYKNIVFRHRLRKGLWIVTHFQAMAEADCAIVLGGGNGTSNAGLSASALRKPVVAIPAFGGGAESVWTEVSQYYKECGVNEDRSNTLRMWDKDSANNVVRIGEQLHKHNPMKQSGRGVLVVCLFVLVALTVGWFAIFLEIAGPLKPWKIVTLLGICALLGNGLRILVNARRDNADSLDGFRVAVELVTSLIVSFALVIFYFLGGIAYVGKPSFLNDAAPDKLVISALSVSLIGLSAGFLLEKAVSGLESAFLPFIKPSTKKTLGM